MQIPVMHGLIDRRILVNFQIDPEPMSRALPAPFRPQLVKGKAIGGICLIRLESLRPKFLPFPWGLQSENAAHRIAVEWDDKGIRKTGVYIPRRDTNSRLNTFAGGRFFPGLHHHANFEVEEDSPKYSVTMHSDDNQASIHVSGSLSERFPETSAFASLDEASEFFQQGSLGYSETNQSGHYDGLELRCQNWTMQALSVDQVNSSYFESEDRFPAGSVKFDSAFLMENIPHEWHSREHLCCDGRTG